MRGPKRTARRTSSRDDDHEGNDLHVTLKSPWLKCGETIAWEQSSVRVTERQEIAPRPFATATLPKHCVDCDGLQAFLQSTETQTSMPFTGSKGQIQHMQAVLNEAIAGPASVAVGEFAGATTSVGLTKGLDQSGKYRLVHPTQEAEHALGALVRREAM